MDLHTVAAHRVLVEKAARSSGDNPASFPFFREQNSPLARHHARIFRRLVPGVEIPPNSSSDSLLLSVLIAGRAIYGEPPRSTNYGGASGSPENDFINNHLMGENSALDVFIKTHAADGNFFPLSTMAPDDQQSAVKGFSSFFYIPSFPPLAEDKGFWPRVLVEGPLCLNFLVAMTLEGISVVGFSEGVSAHGMKFTPTGLANHDLFHSAYVAQICGAIPQGAAAPFLKEEWSQLYKDGFLGQVGPLFSAFPFEVTGIYKFLLREAVLKLLLPGHVQRYQEAEAALFWLIHEWPFGLGEIEFSCADPVKGVKSHIASVLDFLVNKELRDSTPNDGISYVTCKDQKGTQWPLQQSGLWDLMINDDYRKILSNIPGYSVELPTLSDDYTQDRIAVRNYNAQLRVGVTRVFASFEGFVEQALNPGILGGHNFSEDYCARRWDDLNAIGEVIAGMRAGQPGSSI